ncbi:MAG: alpha/beta hydrolase [bacterium]|nr:alpha/beta hydrolase [bacterium]
MTLARRNILNWLLCAAVVALSCFCVVAVGETTESPEKAIPQSRPGERRAPPATQTVERIEDVVFGTGGGRELRLDIIRLKEPAKSPMPVVVWVHGGAWLGGSRKGGPATILAGQGYFVASVEYRLSQEAKFPAQVEDCKCAIRHLRAHAKKYNIDPDRIGCWGLSAGGHLVALLGTSGGVKELEGKGGWQDQSSRVQAVCDWFGPTDFPKMGGSHNDINSPECQLIGGSYTEKADVVRAANPITHVTADDPPFLIMHGENDNTVPIGQSELLDEALKKAGVEVTFVRVKNAGHGFGGAGTEPSREEIQKQIIAFFDKHLKRGE